MPKSPSPKRRILVVDDQKGITALWKLLLEKTGRYIVREENDSRHALATAHKFRPDLVLLDMDMPDLDGSEVAAGVRADELICETPIVFLTSLVTPGEVAAGRRIEGFPCLPKPTDFDQLVRVIEDNLALPLAA